MLNKLPLFSVYQKDRELKLKYLQDYTMLLDKNRELSLIDLPAKDLLLREDAALKIRTEISYLPSFKSLKVKENLIEESRRRISIATS